MDFRSVNGGLFEWRPRGLCYRIDACRILIDRAVYLPVHPLLAREGSLYAALTDLQRIYAPDFTVEQGDKGRLTITHDACAVKLHLGHATARRAQKAELAPHGKSDAIWTPFGLEGAPFEHDGALYVPLAGLMAFGFGKSHTMRGPVHALANGSPIELTHETCRLVKTLLRGKRVGKCSWTYWNGEAGKLEALAVYVPTSYRDDAETRRPLVVQLHGVGSTFQTMSDSKNAAYLMDEAERRGWIVAWPSAYVERSNYGSPILPVGIVAVMPGTNPQNPADLSEARLADLGIAERNVQEAIGFVCGRWPVDQKRVYLMGISMGAAGTWHQLAAYPQRFAAASPSGGFLEPTLFDWSRITRPVYYVGGTEDRNGFDLMVDSYEYAVAHGANIVTFDAVGGALHGCEWPHRICEVFNFFEGCGGR